MYKKKKVDDIYIIAKIIAVYSFSILMISVICKVWRGECFRSSYKKTCTVSPCKVGNYEDAEVNKKVMVKVIEDK